jgi:outer membrane protein assembly factor BamA
MRSCIRLLFCCLVVIGVAVSPIVRATQAQEASAQLPSSLPYACTNCVWWNDDELRSLLKKQIPTLSDEIPTTSVAEGKVRTALKFLLKEKGITAEVQSEEPSSFALTAEQAAGSPPPAVAFSIASPRILIGKVTISGATEELQSSLLKQLQSREGTEYNKGQDWLVRSQVTDALESGGYLDSHIEISHSPPSRQAEAYVVDLLVAITSGPQFHIAEITADGGPLLPGRNLSGFFTQHPGDVVGAGPFGRLAGNLRAYYWQRGFADVEIAAPPILDQEHALVSYHLEVTPGPMYRLATLTIQHLNPDQEERARNLLGMKPGDIFDEMAINALSHKIPLDPLLAGYTFSFSPKKNKLSAMVDLTLDFSKAGGNSSVTIK